jgi:predicted ATPase/DNA-binding CsgD family transcriptional regulator
MATRSSRVGLEAGSGLHNLPVPLTSLVGRARELERVGEIMRRTRLVTLTGPGGVGKTRLALALADRELGRRSAGVWLVDLALGSEPPDVAGEVARMLGLAAAPEPAADALVGYLRDRDPLLVLDNCEHLAASCAELVARLLSSCGSVRILATSRELLGVSGETVWRLEPLGPEDANRLFVERARQRRPEFVPSEDAEATIVSLCARLDRLPLAIELAAARIGVMSPAEILASLDAQAGELGGVGRRGSPARHRTVRATVEWSYRLLEAGEQQAFRRLAVFVGGFDADAARSVVPELSADLLARLVDKSLIAATESPRGRTRYRLLETIREYGHELLVAADELDAARNLQLRHFAAQAELALEEWLQTGRQWLVNELDDDYENVRAALEWAAVADPCAGLRVLAGTRDLFYKFGQSDGFRLAQRLLECCPTRDRYRAAVLIAAGELGNAIGDSAAARALLAEGRELSAQLNEPALEAWTAWFQGVVEITQGQPGAGRGHLERSLALHRRLGSRIGEARALAGLAGTYLFADELAPAKELHEEALSIFVDEQNLWGQGICHVFLGMIAEVSASDPSRASSHYRKAAELLRPSQDATLLPVALVGQASVLVRRDPATAVKVLAAATAMRARAGGTFQPIFQARADRVRAAADIQVGPEFERFWAAGTRLDVDQATKLAFGLTKPKPMSVDGLSTRELEVARLVADGLANKAIAAQLHLSVRTVEVHVRHALAKLGFENRTQIATWARERAIK